MPMQAPVRRVRRALRKSTYAEGENAVSLVSSVNIQLSALSVAGDYRLDGTQEILISRLIYKPAALYLYCFQTMINQGAQGQIILVF